MHKNGNVSSKGKKKDISLQNETGCELLFVSQNDSVAFSSTICDFTPNAVLKNTLKFLL